MKPSPLLKVVALFSLLSCAAAARGQQQSQLSLITVTGQAEVRVPPDEVVFNLEVTKLDKEITVAQQQTDESVRQILALARRYSVAAEDVKTDYISVNMLYSTDLVDDEDNSAAREKKVKREFLGYSVSKTVNVRFRDLGRYEQFFSEVLKAGVSKVESVEFRSSQIRKYRDQARAQAIRAAREKAAALAGEIGQTIGKAYSIEEEGYSRPGSYAQNNTTVISGSFSGEESSAFAPGTISVTAQVTVSFILN
jgi:uncharacterized protein YggE